MKKTAIIVGVFFCVVMVKCSSGPPDDAALIQLFSEKRDVFEQLAKKICRDDIASIRVQSGQAYPIDTNPVVVQWYLVPLRELGVTRIVSWGGCRTDFYVWSRGGSDSGVDKKIVFRPNVQNAIVVPSLDRIDLSDMSGTYLRQLAPNWYLMLNEWHT